MSTFLLIRHAKTDTAGRVLTGRKPGVHLNAEGKAQARRLKERLAQFSIQAVYSSPMERAMETAEAFAKPFGLEVRISADLSEIDFGRWTGLTIESLAADPEWRRFNSLRGNARIPGGESMLEVQARMVAALERWHYSQPGETIAVVSHGDPIRTVLAHYLGIPLDLAGRFEINPASLSTLRIENWGPQVLGINLPA